MDTTTPITKHERRIQSDQKATSRYRRQPAIDRWHDQRRLEQQLKEVWQ